jgi:hypothetical protein
MTERDRGNGGNASGSAAEDVIGSAKEAAREVSHLARDTAKARANGFVETSKNATASHLEQVADALRAAADRDEDQAGMADYTRRAADGLARISRTLRERSLGEMIEATESFARRETPAFLAGTFLAGLAVARFMKASAHHRGAGRSTSDVDRRSASDPYAQL